MELRSPPHEVNANLSVANKPKKNNVPYERVQNLRSIPDTLLYTVMPGYLAQSACYWHNILQPSIFTVN